METHFGISINVSDGPEGRAVLLIRRWFDFSSMHARVFLSKILKLKFPLMHRSGYESLMRQRHPRIRIKDCMNASIKTLCISASVNIVCAAVTLLYGFPWWYLTSRTDCIWKSMYIFYKESVISSMLSRKEYGASWWFETKANFSRH